MRTTIKLALLTGIAFSISACGGGGSGGSPSLSISMPSIPGTDASGVTYETQSATVTATPTGQALGTAELALSSRIIQDEAHELNGATYVTAKSNYNIKVTRFADNNAIQEVGTSTDTIYASEVAESSITDAQIAVNALAENTDANITASVQVRARQDVDVVTPNNGTAFFITNQGTGTKNQTTTTLPFTPSSGLQKYYNDVIAAHANGWTGTGSYIVKDKDGYGVARYIAPDGNVATWIDSYGNQINRGFACVDRSNNNSCYSSTGVTVGQNAEVTLVHSNDPNFTRSAHTDANVAAGIGLVWNKYSTLNDDQIEALVEETADGNVFRLDRALSPVGNLN